MSMSTQGVHPVVNAGAIREFIRKRYVEPARRRHETLLTLRAGDIHRELGLRNRVPNVCQVMESKLLEKEAGVRVSSKQGPPSGRGTTVTLTYEVNLAGVGPAPRGRAGDGEVAAEPGHSGRQHPLPEHPGVGLFFGLRGLGADLFAAEGGGEAWLARERADFYGPGKKELA
jgi:hypothetical protein